MAKGPQQGDRLGDWFLESRAKPVDGKRYWNVVNVNDDRKLVVAQTSLKALENNTYVHGDDVPSSAQITETILAANGNPFLGGAVDDDSEFPFEPSFIEPVSDWKSALEDELNAGEWVERSDHKGFYFVPSENEPDDDDDFDCDECEDDMEPEQAEAIADTMSAESPWDSPNELRKAIVLAMEQVAELKSTIDMILKASLNQ